MGGGKHHTLRREAGVFADEALDLVEHRPIQQAGVNHTEGKLRCPIVEHKRADVKVVMDMPGSARANPAVNARAERRRDAGPAGAGAKLSGVERLDCPGNAEGTEGKHGDEETPARLSCAA